MKVIFAPLPKEPIMASIARMIRRKRRPHEHVELCMNGGGIVIKRGVPVDIPEWARELCRFMALGGMEEYNCYILDGQEEHTK